MAESYAVTTIAGRKEDGSDGVFKSIGGGIAFAGMRGESALFDRMFGGALAMPYTVTADGLVVSGPCIVYGFCCNAGTTPTLVLYNNTAASGQKVHAALAAGHVIGTQITFPCGIYCANGLYADINGASADFTVFALPIAG